MSYIVEKERRTPITDKAEVVMAGGGPAGVAAAIVSARLGVETMLIERYGCLGGLATGGLRARRDEAIWCGRRQGNP